MRPILMFVAVTMLVMMTASTVHAADACTARCDAQANQCKAACGNHPCPPGQGPRCGVSCWPNNRPCP